MIFIFAPLKTGLKLIGYLTVNRKPETVNRKGEMSEWLKEHAWKACVPQKGTVGSNPTLSAFASRSFLAKAGY